jgi:hypothetical protein
MDLFGGAKKTTKSKKTKKTSETKKTKSSTKKTSDTKKTKKSTTTRSKSKTKGGNFLGTVGDLVAPTGWGPFATAAGLLALDRADAALRRGTKEKKEKMKGGKKSEKKMKGGVECPVNSHVSVRIQNPIQFDFSNILKNTSKNERNQKFFSNYYSVKKKFDFSDDMTIYFVNNSDNKIDLKIEATINQLPYSYCYKYNFESISQAVEAIDDKMKLNLGKLVLKEYARDKKINLGNGVFNLES